MTLGLIGLVAGSFVGLVVPPAFRLIASPESIKARMRARGTAVMPE
jgi:hypothetical protein